MVTFEDLILPQLKSNVSSCQLSATFLHSSTSLHEATLQQWFYNSNNQQRRGICCHYFYKNYLFLNKHLLLYCFIILIICKIEISLIIAPFEICRTQLNNIRTQSCFCDKTVLVSANISTNIVRPELTICGHEISHTALSSSVFANLPNRIWLG